jgi:hypothetical protein
MTRSAAAEAFVAPAPSVQTAPALGFPPFDLGDVGPRAKGRD